MYADRCDLMSSQLVHRMLHRQRLEGRKNYRMVGDNVRSAAAPQPLTLLEQEVGRIDWQEPCASAYASWKLKRFQKLAQQLKQAGVPEYSLWESLAEETAAKLGRNPR